MKAKEARGVLKGDANAPTFRAYRDYYLQHANKHPKTLEIERAMLNKWEVYFGEEMRLDNIAEPAVRDFLNKQARPDAEGDALSNASINSRLLALRSMLRMAHQERKIPRFPFDGIKKLKYKAPKKEMPATETIEQYVSTAIAECPRMGKAFADYLHLLMYSGARETEALSLQYSDISFERQQIHFHRNTKFGKSRFVDFNPKLEVLLKDMVARRNEKSPWLFPSPRPNKQGGRITTFRTTLEKVRGKVGVYLSDHLLRHYFISKCVMAGVDRFKLVEWVGHSDGGKLIAEVYGHLDNKFGLSQAAKLTNL
ncbi:MAG: tyrosine-type recombinase/integrase [Verrucomicrobiia bacterium]